VGLTAIAGVVLVGVPLSRNRTIRKRVSLAKHVLHGHPLLWAAGNEMGSIQVRSGNDWRIEDVVVIHRPDRQARQAAIDFWADGDGFASETHTSDGSPESTESTAGNER
jgi:hypothetical protein